MKGCLLLGNCLVLDTCRGPAPKIDVIQCLVVVYPGNVGKGNFPKTSSCFSFPFPFFSAKHMTCNDSRLDEVANSDRPFPECC